MDMSFTTHKFAVERLRVFDRDGEPWSVAADVCRCLQLTAAPSNGSFHSHFYRLNPDERTIEIVPDTRLAGIHGCPSGRRQTLVSVRGVKKLIDRADSSLGDHFRNWFSQTVTA